MDGMGCVGWGGAGRSGAWCGGLRRGSSMSGVGYIQVWCGVNRHGALTSPSAKSTLLILKFPESATTAKLSKKSIPEGDANDAWGGSMMFGSFDGITINFPSTLPTLPIRPAKVVVYPVETLMTRIAWLRVLVSGIHSWFRVCSHQQETIPKIPRKSMPKQGNQGENTEIKAKTRKLRRKHGNEGKNTRCASPGSASLRHRPCPR